ncbi:MAG: cytidine deaminase [Bacteroidales bacterium]
MKKHTIETGYDLYAPGEILPDWAAPLVKAAADASLKAYAPYSGFRVGAAVLLEDGTVVIGNNQENAAYPSGLCAERVALFSAHACYPEQKVKALAVFSGGKQGVSTNPPMPCGACRQVMAETEAIFGLPFPVVSASADGTTIVFPSAEALLPFAFKPEHLNW